MDENAQAPTLMNYALKYGIIMGIAGFILTVLLYVVDYTLLVDWKTGILMLLAFFGIVVYIGINYRNQVGGYIEYGKAFQCVFLALAIGGIVGTVGNLILYNLVDPELPQKLTAAAIDKTVAMMESFGAPEEEIDKQLAKLEKDMPEKFSNVGVLTGYLWALLIYVIMSAVAALIVRKRQPEIM